MIEIHIVTPHGVIYEDTVQKITLPTQNGQITVLGGHLPLLSVLKPGEIIITKQEGNIVSLAVSHGVVDVRASSIVYVMADTAERAEHVDIERAQEAKMRAEELLKQEQDLADVEFARLQAKIEKELVRIHVGKKYRA